MRPALRPLRLRHPLTPAAAMLDEFLDLENFLTALRSDAAMDRRGGGRPLPIQQTKRSSPIAQTD